MDSPLLVLHVGCGNISRLWLEALRGSSDASLVGLVDIDAGVAAERYDPRPAVRSRRGET